MCSSLQLAARCARPCLPVNQRCGVLACSRCLRCPLLLPLLFILLLLQCPLCTPWAACGTPSSPSTHSRRRALVSRLPCLALPTQHPCFDHEQHTWTRHCSSRGRLGSCCSAAADLLRVSAPPPACSPALPACLQGGPLTWLTRGASATPWETRSTPTASTRTPSGGWAWRLGGQQAGGPVVEEAAADV